jgi:hypothetical protein
MVRLDHADRMRASFAQLTPRKGANVRRTVGADLVRLRASLRVLFCTILQGRALTSACFIGAAGKD